MSEYQKNCSRCGADISDGSIMSKFNLDIICMPCKEDEQQAPGYKAADEAEYQAVKAKNYKFPGVGLSAEDSKFLSDRRAQRSNLKSHEHQTAETGGQSHSQSPG